MMRLQIVFIFCLSYNPALAQFTNVLIDDAGNPNETSICVNPVNTQNIVAGANLNFIYQTNDGGMTWQKKSLTSDWGVWGDPCIITDTAGDFYYIHLSNPPDGSWIDRIICQKSTDEGLSWDNGSFTGLNGEHDQDKAWAIFDPATKNIYMAWTQFDLYGSPVPTDSSNILFAKSDDLGSTWSTPKRINRKAGDCQDGDATPEGAVPAVSADGALYVAWSFNDTIWFDRSIDQGQTWLAQDIAAAAQPEGWDYNVPGLYRCNGLPVTKCDRSNGEHGGTIYINWSDQRNGSGNTDVFVARSVDGGNNWIDAVKVNDDNTQSDQFMSWMDVDQVTGAVYVIFYDRRNYSDNNTDVYIAYSTDGGASFTNARISDSSFVPNAATFLGDYNNISCYNGIIAPIWTREDGVISSVWTAQIDFTTLSQANELLATGHFLLSQNVPNPFSRVTSIEMNNGTAGYYTLTLYDMVGRKISDLISNEYLNAGKRSVSLDASLLGLHSGTYYYSLQKGGEVLTKKLVFVNP